MSNENAKIKPGCLPRFLRFLFAESGSKSLAKRSIAEAYNKATSVFLKNEAAFFMALQEGVGDHFLIFPKMRLADIFTVNTASRSQWQSDFNRINAKHIDYLFCEPDSFEPKFVIELDDRSHSRKSRIKRDKFLNELCNQNGLTLVRFPAAMTYSVQKIRDRTINAGGQQQ